ncbi:MAG: Holliday junction resolvase RuvX [Pirellulales bacterium]|nr:Holliday junction resolvase RuvX [Planctomycetales bacterium]
MSEHDSASGEGTTDPVADAFPTSGRLAGIDFGTVRIGVAVTDAGRRLASPLENYTRRSAKLDERYFRELADGERIVGFVVGLPVHTSGDESQKSLEARHFGSWLSRITSRPVTYFDERYTSVEAERYLLDVKLTKKKRKARLDKLAAQIMLSAYLESTRRSEQPEALDDT